MTGPGATGRRPAGDHAREEQRPVLAGTGTGHTGGDMKKLVTYGAIGFAAYYLLTQPVNAANVVGGATGGGGSGAHSGSQFVNALFKKEDTTRAKDEET